MELRDYQARAVASLRHGLRAGHTRQVLMLATGGGKTAISSALMLTAAAKQKRAIFIVNRLTLIDQAAEAFRREGLRIGIIQGQHEWTDYAAPIQVASIQTLQRRQNIPHFDFAVIDEVHEFYAAHRNLIKQNPETPFIGLSATPFAPGLGKWFSNLVVGATTAELAEKGWLVPSITYAPAELPDLNGVKVSRGDYVEKELAGKMQAPQIMGCVVETWLKHGEDRPTLCFAVNIAHSQSMVREFQRAGIKAVHIDAYTDTEERKVIFERFKEGGIKILSSVGVLTTGFDMPNAECVILARPTKSLMLHIQQIGRGLRISPNTGKKDVLILDHAGNTLVHGFAHDPLPDELDDGKERKSSSNYQKSKKDKLPSKCCHCGYVKPPEEYRCSQCGFAPERPSNVEEIDGDLIRVEGKSKKKKLTKADKQRWWSMILRYATRRGFSRGWAAHTYRDRFQIWPRGLKDIEVEPDLDVMRFIKHKQIRYAKSRVVQDRKHG